MLSFDRCKQWVVMCKRQDLERKGTGYLYNNCRLCSAHFEPDSYESVQKRIMLKSDAVPTIFVPKVLLDPKPSTSKMVQIEGLSLRSAITNA